MIAKVLIPYLRCTGNKYRDQCLWEVHQKCESLPKLTDDACLSNEYHIKHYLICDKSTFQAI
jgi:hypothetical protein